jgi:hypothetical protein
MRCGRGIVRVDVPHPQGDDLRCPHPRQAKAQNELVPHPDLAVTATAGEQSPESLVVGEPASRVLSLELPVEPGNPPQRVGPVAQGLDEDRIGQALPHAPAQERRHP